MPAVLPLPRIEFDVGVRAPCSLQRLAWDCASGGRLAAFAGGAIKDVINQEIQAEHAAERADVAHGAEDHFERTGII